ncbi:MAG: hypothetical protein HOP08_18755 [Cyclobacteriaceae bacterium]|nr:hypothetical protein [Cyclobacteriaceae bacterium]
MKLTKIIVVALVVATSCASEIEIASSDVPTAVMTAFNSKYPQAKDVEWEIEKQDGKLYYEAEFKTDGKKMEAYFRPDGTFSKVE